MTTITALPEAPSTNDPANFATEADAFIAALPTFVTQTNAVASEVNANAATAATSVGAAAVAVAAANFKGNWSALTGAAAVPYSVYHLSKYWQLLSNIADITTKVPGTAVEWAEIPTRGRSSASRIYMFNNF